MQTRSMTRKLAEEKNQKADSTPHFDENEYHMFCYNRKEYEKEQSESLYYPLHDASRLRIRLRESPNCAAIPIKTIMHDKYGIIQESFRTTCKTVPSSSGKYPL